MRILSSISTPEKRIDGVGPVVRHREGFACAFRVRGANTSNARSAYGSSAVPEDRGQVNGVIHYLIRWNRYFEGRRAGQQAAVFQQRNLRHKQRPGFASTLTGPYFGSQFVLKGRQPSGS